MPFKSEKQRRYLYANEPEVAQRWSKKYGDKPMKRDRDEGRGRAQSTTPNPRSKRKPERVNKPKPLAKPNLKGGRAIPHPKTKTKPATGNSRLRKALEKKN